MHTIPASTEADCPLIETMKRNELSKGMEDVHCGTGVAGGVWVGGGGV